MVALVLTLIVLAGVCALLTHLVRLGLARGDRPGDARARIALRPASEAPQPTVKVRVDNPGAATVLVSAELRPASVIALAFRSSPAVTLARATRHPELDDGDVLGPVVTDCPEIWDLPLPLGTTARAVRVIVRLHHADGRTVEWSRVLGVEGSGRGGARTPVTAGS